jgi:hypothetical protein
MKKKRKREKQNNKHEKSVEDNTYRVGEHGRAVRRLYDAEILRSDEGSNGNLVELVKGRLGKSHGNPIYYAVRLTKRRPERRHPGYKVVFHTPDLKEARREFKKYVRMYIEKYVDGDTGWITENPMG